MYIFTNPTIPPQRFLYLKSYGHNPTKIDIKNHYFNSSGITPRLFIMENYFACLEAADTIFENICSFLSADAPFFGRHICLPNINFTGDLFWVY